VISDWWSKQKTEEEAREWCWKMNKVRFGESPKPAREPRALPGKTIEICGDPAISETAKRDNHGDATM